LLGGNAALHQYDRRYARTLFEQSQKKMFTPHIGMPQKAGLFDCNIDGIVRFGGKALKFIQACFPPFDGNARQTNNPAAIAYYNSMRGAVFVTSWQQKQSVLGV
jgi:hypothetical protein